MPDVSSQPASTSKTPVHNNITNTYTSLDLSPVLHALYAFMRSTRQCAYPQLIVTCRGQKRAFSRETLSQMGPQGATKLFIARFARAEDYLVTNPGKWTETNHPPAVGYIATFCRTDDENAPIYLDENGWAENIGNVRTLEVVLTRRIPGPW